MLPRDRTTGPYVVLETDRRDGENARSFLFREPVRELRLDAGGDPREFFRSIDAAAADGLWAAGYFAYELGYLLEPKLAPLCERRRPSGPLAWVGIFEAPTEAPAPSDDGFKVSNLRINTARDEYTAAIDRIKSCLTDGETYQVNFTFKQTFDLDGSAQALFEALRRRQRVSYAACIFDGERTVVSLSPELFFRREKGVVRVKPMKGTVNRGATKKEDDELAAWLAADPKNRAENVMIVDMVRNDLGRIAPAGGVRVVKLFEIERYETLHQMTSTVEADVPQETSWFDVFRSLFPCASVTGAPKVRTMELIVDLEKEPRGVYTGAIGYISPGGGACFNVAIRTIVVEANGRAEMGIGSGVVYDSNAHAEYEECLLKGRFLAGAAQPFELVETMRLTDGEVYLRRRHLARLQSSAAHYGFDFAADRVAAALDEAVGNHPQGGHKIRLLLDTDGAVSVSCTPLETVPASVRVKLSEERVDPADQFLYHKTTHRPMYRRERDVALAEGYGEVLFRNNRGEICEGSISNVFVTIGGALFTPPISCGLLPGTLREELIAGGKCRERVLKLSDIHDADQVFVGNSVTGLVAVMVTTEMGT
jgi:para-aminobenzoate synthetase/4-amino-4-deoxychorismate lyase